MGIANKILDILASKLAQAKVNEIDLQNKGTIHETSYIASSEIKGQVLVREGCKIINGVRIIAKTPVNVGRYTSINGPTTEIHARLNKVTIGSFCSIARNVSIQEYNHQYDRASSYYIFQNLFGESVKKDIVSKGKIEIGNDVWIGTNSSILSGVEIGDGVVVAANSVVTKNIPSYSVVAGSPAKVIKKRFSPEIIQRLMEVEWWTWEVEKIRKNRSLFEGTLTLDKLNKIK